MDDRENEYLRTPTEVADALGLPLLGALAAEPRFHQLAESLTSLSPDPRFSGRLYRFIDAEAPLIWVAGLGDAGEELPVAIGLAEMAAATGAAPALLACTRESVPRAGVGAAGVRSSRTASRMRWRRSSRPAAWPGAAGFRACTAPGPSARRRMRLSNRRR